MPEALLLLIGVVALAAFVGAPLRGAPARSAASDDAVESARIAHRAALEALRDVEADHRAGTLDQAAYADELARAEEVAAKTRRALDAAPRVVPPAPGHAPRWAAVTAASIIGLALVGGSLVGWSGLAQATVVNRQLADARAAESARQARIADLLDAIAADPTDAAALSELADAYLAGPDSDLPRAAAALQLLINADPGRPDAYERLMTAYLRAGDYTDARAVHTSYVELERADPAEAAFFDGLIALRGEADARAAVEAFDRFLELAPDDPRAPMIRGLREEAAAGS